MEREREIKISGEEFFALQKISRLTSAAGSEMSGGFESYVFRKGKKFFSLLCLSGPGGRREEFSKKEISILEYISKWGYQKKGITTEFLSVGAETDGLWGKPFAIGASVHILKDGEWKELAVFQGRGVSC